MEMATLAKWARDLRSGEVHLPSEGVTIMGVIRNLDRTLMKVRWQGGGDCVVFPEELAEIRQGCGLTRLTGWMGASRCRFGHSEHCWGCVRIGPA
jgi:hypothetical protein